jgi:hypothetical protein
MKLHVAGRMEPQKDAGTTTAGSSARPSRHGMTWTGTPVEVLNQMLR